MILKILFEAVLIVLLLGGTASTFSSIAGSLGGDAVLGSVLATEMVDGDVKVAGNETFAILDCDINLSMRIVAEQDAVVTVRNANLTLTPSHADGISIFLRDNARLVIENSTIHFSRAVGDCQIALVDEAEANVTGSIVSGWGFLIGRNFSTLRVTDSRFGEGIAWTHSPGVATFGASSASLKSSVMDGVFVWENSSCSINESIVGIVRTAWAQEDCPSVNMSDSHIGSIMVMGGKPVIHVWNSTVVHTAHIHEKAYAWFEDSSVSAVRATGNASVYLVDSSITEVNAEGDARVFVGWRCPVVEVLTVPYQWIPFLQAANIIIMFGGMALVAFAVDTRVGRRKRKR